MKKRLLNIVVIILALLFFRYEDLVNGYDFWKITINILLVIAMIVTTIMVYKGQGRLLKNKYFIFWMTIGVLIGIMLVAREKLFN